MTNDQKYIKALIEQIEWMVNGVYQVGKAGGRIEPGEWRDCILSAEGILEEHMAVEKAEAKEAF